MNYRYFIELAFDGTKYFGWQIQPKQISIQEVINNCLSKKLNAEINVVGAGRTDTGVHASFYVIHFDIDYEILSEQYDEFIKKMNIFLPKDIVFKKIYRVENDKHARFSAISRTYKYYFTTKKNPFREKYSFLWNAELDIEKMNVASGLLMKNSDFTSFSKLHTDVKTNNCKVSDAFWEKIGDELIFTIKADRFLRNMVRSIVGTLFLVGRNKISIEDFQQIIESKDRNKAGKSFPAHALFLTDIQY